ncbi:MAG TPA: ArsC/Spx/MgsR family protein [Egibacteraceae bacterium]|nr:ArsC/Spx/MgsR family protein [Egibacteraceae bacterium]
MQVQLFGLAKSKATRKAQRFFGERRVPVQFVDLRRRAPSPGELRRWVARFGAEELLDPSSRPYREQGLHYLAASDDEWIERMSADPSLLRLPLVRCGRDLAVGDDPQAWQRFADAVKR